MPWPQRVHQATAAATATTSTPPMSRVVEHLAELTGQRDRDVLDVSLVGAFKDLLRPHSVAIYRCVGDTGQQHWLTRARLGPGDVTATADPLWAEPSSLPPLASQPDRQACLLRQDAFTVPATPAHALAMAYFPLASDSEVFGVLEIATVAPLAGADLRLVSSILRIYRNFQGLLDYSERDTLTGLLNRKTFDESFLRIAVQALGAAGAAAPARSGDVRQPGRAGTSWLGLIDIDHFKRVNDEHGHLLGDEALLLLSRLMRTSFRFHDHLYRFGGEEFVVLMRCDDAAAAAAALQRLRAHVERYVFPQLGQMTISIGFTQVLPSDSPASAFDRADKAVYYAKQHGRNQVQHHADLVAAGLLAQEARRSDVELF
jgi:diguanylate cyclase (GGDEF)-like protein